MADAMRFIFLLLALTLFVVALAFGYGQQPWQWNSASTVVAPNVLAGLASLGFAVAGGLSLLAAALVRPDRTPPGP
jgi:hypothetical protein